MIDGNIVGFISALTALIASVIGPFVTIYVARTQFKATVRSANRQKWIDEFRDLIARLCAELATAVQVREKVVQDGRVVIQAESDYLASFGRLVFTANKIRLMVNPHEPEHRELLTIINQFIEQFRLAPIGHDLQTEGLEIVGKLISTSLSIIRQEWIRVQRGV